MALFDGADPCGGCLPPPNWQFAVGEYLACRAGRAHCGPIVVVAPPPPPAPPPRDGGPGRSTKGEGEGDTSEGDDDVSAALLRAELLGPLPRCCCSDMLDTWLAPAPTPTATACANAAAAAAPSCSSGASDIPPPPPPPQWLLPGAFAVAALAQRHWPGRVDAAEWLVLAVHDVAGASLHRPSYHRGADWPDHARGMAAPMCVVARIRDIARFARVPAAAVAPLLHGVGAAVRDGAAFAAELLACPPIVAALSPHHASLPGGALECYGTPMLWDAAAFLAAAASAADGDAFFAPRPSVGALHDDAALLAQCTGALRASLAPLLPVLFGGGVGDAAATAEDRASAVARWLAALPSACAPLLLGCRVTTGSVTASARGVLPFAPHECLAAFQQRHEAGQAFTVGGRALAKHHHRDQTQSWWGCEVARGSQADKNAAAVGVLYRVMTDGGGGGGGSAWRNVHMLPHDIVTYEIRCPAGYGARWAAPPRCPDSEAGAARAAPGAGNEPSLAAAAAATTGVPAAPALPASAGDDGDDAWAAWVARTAPLDSAGQRRAGPALCWLDSRLRVAAHCAAGPCGAPERVMQFRGFLEPHDAEGHTKGWRH